MKIALFTLVLFSLVSCGSGDSDNNPSSSSKAKITGTITGNGYASISIIQRTFNFLVSKTYAASSSKPDAILVMYNKGNNYKEFPINDDGSFEIDTSLLSQDDLIIFVVNSITKEILGNINLATSSSAKLDLIDTSKLESDLNVGSIDLENNCCASTETVNSVTSFSSDSIEILEDIAISDDSLLIYQNKYKSPDYKVEIQALYTMDALTDIQGSFSDINSFTSENLTGIRPTVGAQLTIYDNITENNIYLFPPENVNYTTQRDRIYNQVASMVSAIPATYKGTNNGNFYEFAFVDSFPKGDWLLKIDGDTEVKGKFSFNGAYPYDSNGNSIIPVPQIKLNMDTQDNSKIKSIDVKWVIFDSSTYKEVSEEFMNSLAYQDHGGKLIAALRSNYGQDIGIFESSTWNGNYTISNGASISLPTTVHERRINMAYNIGQVSYQYLFQ